MQYFFDMKLQAASGFGLAICCTRLASCERTNTQYANRMENDSFEAVGTCHCQSFQITVLSVANSSHGGLARYC